MIGLDWIMHPWLVQSAVLVWPCAGAQRGCRLGHYHGSLRRKQRASPFTEQL